MYHLQPLGVMLEAKFRIRDPRKAVNHEKTPLYSDDCICNCPFCHGARSPCAGRSSARTSTCRSNIGIASGNIGTNNPTYTWNSVFDASWYYIYIQGPSGLVHADWYSAAQVCVASTCSLPNVKTLAVGEHRWWIQTWNSNGYGPWSTGMTFTVPAPTPPGKPL